MSSSKQQLGQFFSTNADYILQGLEPFVKDKKVVDPFAGAGDLLSWALNNRALSAKGYDIKPANESIGYNDSFKDPIDYSGLFVITNPPYLIKGKSVDKSVFDLYKTDDLYKAFILSIIGKVDEGIVIVPINFLSSEDSKIRDKFFSQYQIVRLNLFEEQVFDDTPSTVCAFYYKKGKNQPFDFCTFPSNTTSTVSLEKKYEYKYGNDFYEYLDCPSVLKCSRLVVGNKEPNVNIHISCLDGGSSTNRIKASICEPYYGKISDRAKLSISTNIDLSSQDQEALVKLFNEILEKFRLQYNSLFLPNFRQSSSLYARKRIPFSTVYKLLNAVYVRELQQK